MATLICDICAVKGAQVRRVPRSYGKGNRLLVIENVPILDFGHSL